MTDNHSAMTRVVVIGGGYVGSLAANHLRLRADIDVTARTVELESGSAVDYDYVVYAVPRLRTARSPWSARG